VQAEQSHTEQHNDDSRTDKVKEHEEDLGPEPKALGCDYGRTAQSHAKEAARSTNCENAWLLNRMIKGTATTVPHTGLLSKMAERTDGGMWPNVN
jgi:hypothetical protein